MSRIPRPIGVVTPEELRTILPLEEDNEVESGICHPNYLWLVGQPFNSISKMLNMHAREVTVIYIHEMIVTILPKNQSINIIQIKQHFLRT